MALNISKKTSPADVDSSAKGDLIVNNGSDIVSLPIGTNNQVLIADSAESTGIKWDDVSTVVSTPFTSQRLDLSSTLQLTSSNARYLYLSAVGGTQDVILTDPPSTNDFFYVVNRDGTNPIQIKETAAGAVEQTLTTASEHVQCHYDGTEWQYT